MSAAPLLPDRQTILAGLSAGAHAMLASLSVSAETGSTQSDALATATPAQGCAVFVSDRQSSLVDDDAWRKRDSLLLLGEPRVWPALRL